MLRIILATTATIAFATAAHGQAATAAKPGNCAIWLEEASKTVATDARFESEMRAEIVAALDTFAAAQNSAMEDQMPQTYKDAEAYGWDKAKVDQMIAENETALRAGFRTPTMAPDTLYMDHLMAINGCIQANTEDSQFGMPRADFIDTLEQAIPIVMGN